MTICKHCGEERTHFCRWEHPRLCCDCYDLSWGMQVTKLNAERAARGKPPLEPWPAKERTR